MSDDNSDDDFEAKLEFAKELIKEGKEIFLKLEEVLQENFGSRSVSALAFAATMLDFHFMENLVISAGEDAARKMSSGFIKVAPSVIKSALEEREKSEEIELGINMPSDKKVIH